MSARLDSGNSKNSAKFEIEQERSREANISVAVAANRHQFIGSTRFISIHGTRRKKTQSLEISHRFRRNVHCFGRPDGFRPAGHETGILRPHLVRHLLRLVDVDHDGHALLKFLRSRAFWRLDAPNPNRHSRGLPTQFSRLICGKRD